MSEEEKKTFKFLKDVYNLNFKSCTIENCDIKNIVNTIEKLQKEIEKLKENYQILKDDIEGHKIVYVDTPDFEENFISKDKIKEKIEELKNRKIGASTGIFAVQVDILEELLGE